MLKKRDDILCAQTDALGNRRRPSWFFNSFFMTKLLPNCGQYEYGNVINWSKNFDVFSMDKVFFPVNIGNIHWTMTVAFIHRREIH